MNNISLSRNSSGTSSETASVVRILFLTGFGFRSAPIYGISISLHTSDPVPPPANSSARDFTPYLQMRYAMTHQLQFPRYLLFPHGPRSGKFKTVLFLAATYFLISSFFMVFSPFRFLNLFTFLICNKKRHS